MFKEMSNREFSDWCADAAMRLEAGSVIAGLVEAFREASLRVRSDAEFQMDLRVTPMPEPPIEGDIE